MPETFTAQVTRWARASDARLDAIQKTAIQSVAEEIVLDIPVATGFLRSSFSVTKGKPPPIRVGVGPTSAEIKAAKAGTTSYEAQPYALTINGMKAGDTMYGVFVADYAAPVEYGARGKTGVRMVGKAVQRWQIHVNNAIRAAKARVRGK